MQGASFDMYRAGLGRDLRPYGLNPDATKGLVLEMNGNFLLFQDTLEDVSPISAVLFSLLVWPCTLFLFAPF